MRKDRDQLFAEALKLYLAGEFWFPNAEFETHHIKPEQDARFDSDPWEVTIRNRLTQFPTQAVYVQGLLDNPLLH